MSLQSSTLHKISWDTIFLSVLTCLSDAPFPPVMMCYLLLLSLTSATFISILIGGEGGQMPNFAFLDAYFDMEEGECEDSKCLDIFVQGC